MFRARERKNHLFYRGIRNLERPRHRRRHGGILKVMIARNNKVAWSEKIETGLIDSGFPGRAFTADPAAHCVVLKEEHGVRRFLPASDVRLCGIIFFQVLVRVLMIGKGFEGDGDRWRLREVL